MAITASASASASAYRFLNTVPFATLDGLYPTSKKVKMKRCDHCGGDITARNPIGHCDHLHYPEYCRVCQRIERQKEEKK